MTPVEKHNALVVEVIKLLNRNTDDSAQLCVAVESVLVGVIELQHKLYGFPKAQAVDLVEAAMYEAIKRYTKG